MADIQLRITVKDDGSVVIRSFGQTAEKELGRVEVKADEIRRATETLGRQGGLALAAIGASLTAAGGIATRTAAQFDAGLREVNTLLNLSEAGFQSLKGQVIALDPALGSTKDLVAGLYQTISAGISKPKQALAFLEQAAIAAKGGVAQLDTAVLAGTKTLQAFSSQGVSSQQVFDVLFQTVKLGQTRFDELAVSAGDFVATAASMNASIEESFGALAQLTLTAGSTTQASTQLDSIFRALIKPTTAMKDAIKKMGFETGSAAIESIGFVNVLRNLVEQAGGNEIALGKLFTRAEALRGVMALSINDFAGVTEKIDEMGDAAGSAQAAFEEVQKSAEDAVDRLTAAFERAGISIGTNFLPIVTDTADASASLVTQFTNLDQATQKTAVFMGVATAAITSLAGVFLLMLPRIVATQAALSTLGLTLGILASPAVIGALVAGFALLAVRVAGARAEAEDAALALANIEGRIVDNALAVRDLRETFRDAGEEGLRVFLNEMDPAVVKSQEFSEQLSDLRNSGDITKKEFIAIADVVADVRGGLESAGDAAEAAAAQLDDAAADVKELADAMKTLGVVTSKDLEPSLEALEKVVSSGAGTLNQNERFLSDLINKYREAGLVTPRVAARLDTLRVTLEAQGASFKIAEIAAVNYDAALEVLQQQRIDEIADEISEDASKMAGAFEDAEGAVADFIVTLPTDGPPAGFSKFISGIKGGFLEIGKGLGLLTEGPEGKLKFGLGGFFEKLGGGIVEGLGQQLAGLITNVLSSVTSLVLKGIKGLGKKIADAFTESTGESLKKDFLKFFALEISEKFGDTLGEQFGRDGTDAVLRGLDQIVQEVGTLDLTQFENIVDIAFKSTIRRFQEGKIAAADFVDAFETSLPILARDLQRFNEQGKVTQQTFEDFLVGAIQPLEAVRQGTLSATDAAKIYEASFLDIQRAFLDFGQAGQDAIRQIINTTRELGVESDAVTQVVVQGAGQIVGGVRAIISAGIESKEEAKFAARALSTAFRELIAQGVPVRDVVEEIGGDARDLADVFKDQLGRKAPKGVREILKLTKVLSAEGIPEAIDKTKAFADVVSGLGEIGLLTKNDFDAFGTEVTTSFDKLIEAGAKPKQALVALGPELQTLADLQRQFGFEVDEGTQKLLDQAIAQGVVKGATLDAAEATQAGFEGLFERFDALLEKMGVATGEFFTFGDAATDVMAKVQDETSITAKVMEQQFTVATSSSSASLTQFQAQAFTTFQQIASDANVSATSMQASVSNAADKIGAELDFIGSRGDAAFKHIGAAAGDAVEGALGDFERMRNELVGASIFPDTSRRATEHLQAIRDAAELAAAGTERAFQGAGGNIEQALRPQSRSSQVAAPAFALQRRTGRRGGDTFIFETGSIVIQAPSGADEGKIANMVGPAIERFLAQRARRKGIRRQQ